MSGVGGPLYGAARHSDKPSCTQISCTGVCTVNVHAGQPVHELVANSWRKIGCQEGLRGDFQGSRTWLSARTDRRIERGNPGDLVRGDPDGSGQGNLMRAVIRAYRPGGRPADDLGGATHRAVDDDTDVRTGRPGVATGLEGQRFAAGRKVHRIVEAGLAGSGQTEHVECRSPQQGPSDAYSEGPLLCALLRYGGSVSEPWPTRGPWVNN